MATVLILIALIVLPVVATVRLTRTDRPTTTPPASHRNDEFVPNLSAKF